MLGTKWVEDEQCFRMCQYFDLIHHHQVHVFTVLMLPPSQKKENTKAAWLRQTLSSTINHIYSTESLTVQ